MCSTRVKPLSNAYQNDFDVWLLRRTWSRKRRQSDASNLKATPINNIQKLRVVKCCQVGHRQAPLSSSKRPELG
jgi:hypothetical protein